MSFTSMHNDYLDPDMPELEIAKPKAGYDEDCPYCGEIAEWVDDGWNCTSCDFEQKALPEDYQRGEQYTALKPRIDACRTAIYNAEPKIKPCSADEFFSCAPDEGDFEWDSTGIGEWHVYACGEGDCPVGWHKQAFSYDIGRVDGKRYIRYSSCDEDGNWDCADEWNEKNGDNPEAWERFYRECFASESFDYLRGWAEYCLDCAETGEDPLGQYIGKDRPENWAEFCVNTTENLIKYL